MKRVLLAMALIVGVTSPTWADFRTGNNLRDDCNATKESNTYYQQSAWCIAYIQGVFDATEGRDKGLNGFTFCSPQNVQAGQARDIVTKYLNDYPQRRHYGAAALIVDAMSVAFPCPK